MSSRLDSLRLRRRQFNRLTLGAGALAGVAPTLSAPLRAAKAAPFPRASLAPLAAVDAADRFGANEAFKAAKFGQASGAGWTRWTVQWFNVQPTPGDLNEFYFRDQ